MCDYSLHHVKSRPAKVGDKLTTRNFGTGTRGFAAPEDVTTAVCVLPGTELAFARNPTTTGSGLLGWGVKSIGHADCDLPASQQGPAADASRCAGIPGRAENPPDRSLRGSGSDRAAVAGAARQRGRGRGPETRRLCRLSSPAVDACLVRRRGRCARGDAWRLRARGGPRAPLGGTLWRRAGRNIAALSAPPNTKIDAVQYRNTSAIMAEARPA